MSTHELAWAAGFFDGEGCVTLCKGYARISITSTDLDMLERFRDAVGRGEIYDREGYQNSLGSKRQWQYAVGNLEDIELIYVFIGPFLCLRRLERFEEVLKMARANRYDPKGQMSWQVFGKRHKDLTSAEQRQYGAIKAREHRAREKAS